MSDAAAARRLYSVVEPLHALVYFAPEARAAYDAAGLRGGWMGYFASRSAALGCPSPDVVTALFFNFHRAMVARALPDAWERATPGAVLAARLTGVDAALRRVLGDAVDSPEVAAAAELALAAADGAGVEGRALFAAHAALPVPDAPHLRLWHATTLLREHRGDGHVAALLSAGLDGVEANVLQVATMRTTREMLQPFRGWSDEEWDAAADRLAQRGWTDQAGAATHHGRAERAAVEATTDELAIGPVQRLGPERTEQLVDLLAPLARRVLDTGGIPAQNPMGFRPDS